MVATTLTSALMFAFADQLSAHAYHLPGLAPYFRVTAAIVLVTGISSVQMGGLAVNFGDVKSVAAGPGN